MELLAPSGNYASFIASINAGADAIYLGGKNFSARAYSTNFSNEEIKEMIKYAHIRGVKVYVTLNTLLFEDEFFDAVEFASFLYQNDVDAILLQDLGLANYLHKVYPDLILHASTQLNCHNIIQAQSLINVGFKRLVLAREVSIQEAKKIKDLGVEVEVFVHGSLCVSYSGNCLMSSFIGGRSGNRGRCAQPCRHHVEVGHDDETKKEYGISTKDLMTLELIEEYKKIGITSLKIEGRMKSEEYVYQVVSSYRKAIDQKQIDYSLEEERIKKLFNRKFTKGYIFNEGRTNLLNQDTPSNLGVKLGTVVDIKKDYAYVKLEEDVHINDGVKFLNDSLDGMLLTRFSVNRNFVKDAKKGEIIAFKFKDIKLTKGVQVNKTSDYLLIEEITNKMKEPKLIPLSLIIKGKVKDKLTLVVSDERNNEVEVSSSFILQEPISNPTSKERIIEQLKKVDNYPFFYFNISYLIEGEVFIPISSLNSLRRELLSAISKKRENINHYSLVKKNYSCPLERKEISPQTFVKCETKEQLEVLKDRPYSLICLDSLKKDGFTFLNRINHNDFLKLKDKQMSSYYKEVENGFTMMSSYGNVTNSYTLDLLFEKGYSLVFSALECSLRQISLMNEAFNKRHGFYPNLGIYIYGRNDYMIMKSCPISSSLGMKKDHCNLCKKNRYYLKDHLDVKFPLISDENCTTRVLSNRPLCLFSKLSDIRMKNINFYFIDFTIEPKEEIDRVLECYQEEKSLSNKDFYGHFINEVE